MVLFLQRFLYCICRGEMYSSCLSEILFILPFDAFVCHSVFVVLIYSFADMDDAVDKSYHPGSEFVEDKREPLIDLEPTDSTELWLIQWPINQV